MVYSNNINVRQIGGLLFHTGPGSFGQLLFPNKWSHIYSVYLIWFSYNKVMGPGHWSDNVLGLTSTKWCHWSKTLHWICVAGNLWKIFIRILWYILWLAELTACSMKFVLQFRWVEFWDFISLLLSTNWQVCVFRLATC